METGRRLQTTARLCPPGKKASYVTVLNKQDRLESTSTRTGKASIPPLKTKDMPPGETRFVAKLQVPLHPQPMEMMMCDRKQSFNVPGDDNAGLFARLVDGRDQEAREYWPLPQLDDVGGIGPLTLYAKVLPLSFRRPFSMSNFTDADIAAIVDEISSFKAYNFVQFSANVLIFYEYLVTFTTEVSAFWISSGGSTGAMVLFFLNSYLAEARAQFLLDLMQYVSWAAFTGLPLNLTLYKYVEIVDDPVMGVINVNASPAFLNARTSLMLADILAISVTWYNLRRDEKSKSSLANVLIRDGAIYFLTIFSLNAIHMSLTLASILSPVQTNSEVTTFTEPLTSILVSRFLLNLQAVKNRTAGDVSTIELDGTTSSVVFERVFGSLAASVDLAADERGGEDVHDEASVVDSDALNGARPSDESKDVGTRRCDDEVECP
ncbi:uncharacterized protein BXZ73DRAFT_103420 [Epithele typhae]|uniref:uncharacterized protein n=1 Tax=Epithele typhae TaxID=378194 RepID=UPI002007A45A|nr:uncharacterized protein BXZ73DRAFT_103420 [Epithele typhae]KAH9925049.1 hypothetical protein BXZ73DRAFT_103420 [Epithele typhae]